MKHNVFFALIALSLVSFAEDEKISKSKVSPGFANRREEVMTKKYGGFVRKPGTGEGYVLFANVNTNVSSNSLDFAAKRICRDLRVHYRVANINLVSLRDGKSILKNQKATAGLFLINDKNLPNLVTIPDQRHAYINIAHVSNLSNDRLLVLLARAFGFVCGAGVRATTGHLLGVVNSQTDLERIRFKYFPGDVLITMQAFLRDSGIKTYQIRTYRQACSEGWAPKPSNQWQQAIWDEVYSVPKNPMKIEFDPKKGR